MSGRQEKTIVRAKNKAQLQTWKNKSFWLCQTYSPTVVYN